MNPRLLRGSAPALAALLLAGCASAPEAPAVAAADRWEAEIAAFETADRQAMPPPGGVVFVGSSSIRLWDSLAEDFPGVPVVNRGFGGSELADAVRFAERIVIPYRPRLVVVYAGDNDLWNGKSPQRVFEDFRALVREIHAELPATRVAFIAIKPSVARWRMEREIRTANGLVEAYAQADPLVDYIDVFTPMLDSQGRPRPELLVEDGLHMTDAGYRIWAQVVRPFLRADRL